MNQLIRFFNFYNVEKPSGHNDRSETLLDVNNDC